MVSALGVLKKSILSSIPATEAIMFSSITERTWMGPFDGGRVGVYTSVWSGFLGYELRIRYHPVHDCLLVSEM